MSVTLVSPPESGQLVSVRARRWVVGEVSKSTLPPPTLGPVPAAPQHLVSLLSVEDDALGEELQVVWEIEPGATVIEKVALPEPTGFDPPDRLDAFLDAVRWGPPPPSTCGTSSPPSARASTSRTTSSTPWSAPSRCPASACSSPTTSASA